MRVHGKNNKARSWIMKEEAVRGLSASQLRAKYQIPDLPTHISDVHVPAGTKMHRGRVNEILGDQGILGSGAVQYNLQERLPVDFFTNTRLL